jgi:aldose 1-epimerase
VKIVTSSFGFSKRGQEVKQYVFKNQNDFEVTFLSYGASIQSIYTKEKSGKSINVALGLNNIEGKFISVFQYFIKYLKIVEYEDPIFNSIHLGGIIGRTSNRISKSEFTLDGIKYKLDRNDNENSLHGGFFGFDMVKILTN